jgi:hypothetical protein
MSATTIVRDSFVDSTGPGTGDIWNSALINSSIYDNIDDLFKDRVVFSKATSGAQMWIVAEHTSNTAGSDALLAANAAGASGGDAYAQFQINGVQSWVVGVDNSDADCFKISASNVLGTSDMLRITPSGTITFPSSAMCRCAVFNNAAQSVAGSSFVTLTFNSEEIDTDASHSTVSNTSRLTVPANQGGVYLVMASTNFGPVPGGSTAGHWLRLLKNGTTVVATDWQDVESLTSVNSGASMTWIVTLVATDFLEVQVKHLGVSSVNVGGATRDVQSQFAYARIL